jgi:hypothetical protein
MSSGAAPIAKIWLLMLTQWSIHHLDARRAQVFVYGVLICDRDVKLRVLRVNISWPCGNGHSELTGRKFLRI